MGLGPNYLDSIATEIRTRVAAGDLPDEDTSDLFRLYALLLLSLGDKVAAGDVHNAWVAWMASIDPSHEALVPADELSAEVASADEPFVRAIRETARALGEPHVGA